MDNFKIDNWEGKIPKIQSIEKNKILELRKKLNLKFFFKENDENDNFFNKIKQFEIFLGNTDNDLFEIIKRICPYIEKNTFIYIDWNGFNDIDKVKLEDFINNLDNFWYSNSDDISIFDDNCEWIINIYHYSEITFSLAPKLLRCREYNL